MGTNGAPLPELVLVEDDPNDEMLSLRRISQSGIPCRVTVPRDGADPIAHLLEANDPPPSLIVLDYKLPSFTGYELLVRLRAGCRVPINHDSDIPATRRMIVDHAQHADAGTYWRGLGMGGSDTSVQRGCVLRSRRQPQRIRACRCHPRLDTQGLYRDLAAEA